ncbi:MAG: NUDIX domain-containing protein [Phycisphaerales bacterium]|nr:NUDIX domain-containing protein [Phycisphaerales bacterium]
MAERSGPGDSLGVAIRTDIVEAFIFRRTGADGVELLQLLRHRRAAVSPATWQPVLGHIEADETAIDAIRREVFEETGLTRDARLGLWQLEQVHPFYMAAINAVLLCPRFAAEVISDWEPKLNGEHEAHRWVTDAEVRRCFVWPGQRAAIDELRRDILDPDSPCAALLRIE